MDNKVLLKKIEELKPWYQNINFNDEVSAVSSHSKLSGEYAWGYIKQLLPESLEGKRVLDLGSNGGLFSIRCAQMGAGEVIGIEREHKHLRQCAFVKEYFNTPNVKFLNHGLENLASLNLGKFDIVLAIAVLYWVGRGGGVSRGHHYDEVYRNNELRFIDYVTTLSNCFVVRARGKQYNSSEYYGEIFNNRGFDMERLINEDTGTHEMMLFRRR